MLFECVSIYRNYITVITRQLYSAHSILIISSYIKQYLVTRVSISTITSRTAAVVSRYSSVEDDECNYFSSLVEIRQKIVKSQLTIIRRFKLNEFV